MCFMMPPRLGLVGKIYDLVENRITHLDRDVCVPALMKLKIKRELPAIEKANATLEEFKNQFGEIPKLTVIQFLQPTNQDALNFN